MSGIGNNLIKVELGVLAEMDIQQVNLFYTPAALSLQYNLEKSDVTKGTTLDNKVKKSTQDEKSDIALTS